MIFFRFPVMEIGCTELGAVIAPSVSTSHVLWSQMESAALPCRALEPELLNALRDVLSLSNTQHTLHSLGKSRNPISQDPIHCPAMRRRPVDILKKANTPTLDPLNCFS